VRILSFIAFTGTFAAVIAVAGCVTSSIRQTEPVACISHMRAIGSACRQWAVDDGNDFLPSDLLTASNTLVTPRVLHCPSDGKRPAVTNWASFTLSQSSYELVTPHLRDMDTNGAGFAARAVSSSGR
jgi:hypothetical protein